MRSPMTVGEWDVAWGNEERWDERMRGIYCPLSLALPAVQIT